MAEQSPGRPIWIRLLWARWWVLSLIIGPPFGLIYGIAMAVSGYRPGAAVAGGVVGALLFGLAMGPFLAWLYRRARPAADAVPDGRHREVRRAAARGPVPADPAVREAALRIVEYQLVESSRYRGPAAVLLGLFTVLEAVAALIYTPWLWVGAVLFLAILVLQARQPERLRRRIAELRG